MFRCLADDCTHPSLTWHGIALHMSHAHDISDDAIASFLIEHLAIQLDAMDAPKHPEKQSIEDEIDPTPSTIVSYVGSWGECTRRALEHRTIESNRQPQFGSEVTTR